MTKNQEQIENIRHTLAHLLAAAVLKKYPKAKLGIGPTIENGFYYDFFFPSADERRLHADKRGQFLVGEADLPELEVEMRRAIKEGLEMKGEKVTPEKAKKFFKDQPFKLELIKDFTKDKKSLTIYSLMRQSDPGSLVPAKSEVRGSKSEVYFSDLCKGGHTANTREINPDAFKLTHTAGAYWRGDEKNPQLQRIYGVAFETKDELENYLAMVQEAKKRDHRKLGRELELFTIIDEIGAGLPLFYPKGAVLRRELENFISEIQESRGYEPIWIPHITKGELYKISGHLDKYDAMYPPMKLKGESDYYIKPMNCPHFMMLYKSLPHSYRELPVRFVSTTANYRYEKSGELGGLTRVRALTQDDCHVFATPEQLESEINLMLDMVQEVYKVFGFKDFWVRISTHDPKDKKKYIGDEKIWKQSEEILERLIKTRNWRHEIGAGEAAFYGPKLDFIFKDVIGRDWQLSTVQLDMNLPKRFALEYIDADGKKKEPVVIHRAILGSTERFLGILIEHFAGAFPVWLSPIQARILAISDKQKEYAEGVRKLLIANGVRVELTESNETLGKRIREAQLQKVPYILVVGDKEKEAGTVSVRHYKRGDDGVMQKEELIARIKKEIENKVI